MQTYSMDCYFRQSWVDRRLEFKGAHDTLALSISMLGRIWKPDTYFYNGKQSYLHTITTPNKFVRLYQDGRVLYSSRWVENLRFQVYGVKKNRLAINLRGGRATGNSRPAASPISSNSFLKSRVLQQLQLIKYRKQFFNSLTNLKTKQS